MSVRSSVSARTVASVLACVSIVAPLSIAASAGATTARSAGTHAVRSAGTRALVAVRAIEHGRVHALAEAVSSLSVKRLNQDEAITATVNGSGFTAGAVVSLGKGVAVVVRSVTPTAITVRIDVHRDASTGWRSLTVTDPKGASATRSHAAYVDHAPVIERWAVGDGAASWSTSLVRPTFATKPTLTFSGAGVTVVSETLGAGGRVDLTFSIASDAPAGWREMTIAEGAATWSVPHGIKVRLGPVVSTVAPLGQGATNQTVRVTGSNFEVCKTKEPTVSVSGPGVTVTKVSAALGNLMYVTLTVASTAVIGPRDMTVTNCDSGGVATSPGVFHVVGPPTVTAIAPIAIGVRRTEVVIGTNLTPGTSFVASGTGVTFSHRVWLSSTRMRVRIDVAATATLGSRDVTASDAGGAQTLNAAVLTIDPLPTETAASPKGIGANTHVVMTVFGTGFLKGAVVTIGTPGARDKEILLGPAVVDSATKLRVVVAATAATKLRTELLTVTNPDGGAASTLKFTTNPGPALHVASSLTTEGALTTAFTKPAGAPASEIYDIQACTNSSMTLKCVQVDGFKNGRTLEGLVPGLRYYVVLTALANGGFFVAKSSVVGPYRASVRLHPPQITKTASTSTTIRITFKGSSNAPAGQTYTVRACLNAAMTLGCVTRSHYRSGVAITGVHKAKYFVRIFAVASAGYLPSYSSIAAA